MGNPSVQTIEAPEKPARQLRNEAELAAIKALRALADMLEANLTVAAPNMNDVVAAINDVDNALSNI